MKSVLRRPFEKGQTLLLGLMALVILLFVAGFVFDLQSIIRAKFKSKTAIDAAALAGGNWQRHTLNMIGDLNLIKASTLMLTDIPPQGGSLTSPQDVLALAESVNNITEMQTRASFVGPLVGFGSAQQAAKANGLNGRKDYAEVVLKHIQMLEGSDVYRPPSTADSVNGFEWRESYLKMLYAIYEGGNGVAVSGNRVSVLYPRLNSTAPNLIGYLTTKEIYDAINANFWCGVRDLLRESFNGDKWYGDIWVAFDSSSFIGASEYFPVGVTFSRSRSVFETALDPKKNVLQPWLDKRNFERIDQGKDKRNPGEFNDDGYYDPLRYSEWATFDPNFWQTYSDEYANTWEGYLRSPIKREYRYQGCNIRVKTLLEPKSLSQKVLATASPANTVRVVDGKYRLEQGLRQMEATAMAKPFGYLKAENGDAILPHGAARMILPCFEETALIPTALEASDNLDEFDYQWYAFLTEYLPALGTVGSVDEMNADVLPDPSHWPWFTQWHNALLKLADPVWRQQGLDWLDEPVYNDKGVQVGTNEDKCDVPPPGGGGPRPPNGPGSLH